MGSVKSREKCLKEIKLLQQVNHENIVQYKDSFIDPSNDDLVIVLEWAQGNTHCRHTVFHNTNNTNKKNNHNHNHKSSNNNTDGATPGGDLKKLIRKVRKANRGFSERQVWKYCSEIAAALQHMHARCCTCILPPRFLWFP